MSRLACTVVVLLILFLCNGRGLEDCSYSLSGSTFDLSPLRVDDLSSQSYKYESSMVGEYSYMLNICGPVTPANLPRVCESVVGAVLQYKLGIFNGRCSVAGKIDAMTFSLIDKDDPARGVSIQYPDGETCDKGLERSTTVDVYCANTMAKIKSAEENESRECSYNIIMESYYGCPTECGITSNGLCNSHGSCATDTNTGASYCNCDRGYSGTDCSSSSGLSDMDMDNDIFSSLPYMYSADTESKRWKGNLLLLIGGMLIALVCGGCFVVVRDRMRARTGYKEILQGEPVDSNGLREGEKDYTGESIYIHKGGGDLGCDALPSTPTTWPHHPFGGIFIANVLRSVASCSHY